MVGADRSVGDFLADVDHARRTCAWRSIDSEDGLFCRISTTGSLRMQANMFLNTFSLSAFHAMSSDGVVAHALLPVRVSCVSLKWTVDFQLTKPHRQECLCYLSAVFTAGSSFLCPIRGQRRPNTSQTTPAAITMSISRRSALAKGAASSAGH